MKEVQKLAAQGDVLYKTIPGLPWRAVKSWSSRTPRRAATT